ncbi:MAG: HEAT repeat domain-containing protein [Minicystis sp.]
MQNEQISNEHPKLSALIEDARQVVDGRGCLGSVKDRVRDVITSGELQSVVTRALQQIASDPAANPALMQQENLVLCNDFNGLLLAVGTTRFIPDSPIYTSSSDALIGAASASGFCYRRYSLSESYDNSVFDPNVAILAGEHGSCPFGDAVLFPQKAASEYRDNGSLVLKVIDQRSADCAMWEFDRHTRRARRAYAADAGGTTLRYLLRFLSEFGNATSVDAARRLLSHPHHYIRWDAVKAIGMLDAGELGGVLHTMLDDPHPHIRSASQKMLQQIER